MKSRLAWYGFVGTLLLGSADLARGQESTPLKDEVLHLNVGIGSVQGQSNIDPDTGDQRSRIVASEVRLASQKTFLSVQTLWAPDTFGGFSTAVATETRIFSIGRAAFGIGARYFYATEREQVHATVPHFPELFGQGTTRKQYFAFGFNGGTGNYREPHIRVYASAGATEINKQAPLALNGQQVKIGDDILPVMIIGGHGRLPNFYRLDIQAGISTVRVIDIKDLPNVKGLIPASQTLFELSAMANVFKVVDAGFFLNRGSSDAGMIFLGNSFGIRAALSF